MFQIKSPYYHWVLSPTDFPCSNEFLLALAYPVLPSCIPSSMRISDSRIKYLGHILRHPDSAESFIMFNPSHPLRTISSPFRRGAWPAHWPELALAEAAHRATIFHNSPPLLGQLTHSFYQHFTIVELKRFSSVSMKHWYNTTRLLYLLIPISENREQWTYLTPKLK